MRILDELSNMIMIGLVIFLIMHWLKRLVLKQLNVKLLVIMLVASA